MALTAIHSCRVCLQAIAKNLCGIDTLNARLVCQRWRSIIAPLVHVASECVAVLLESLDKMCPA